MLENLDKRKIAYFIGFMSGDGSYESGAKRTPRMSVSTTDIEVVNWISNNIEEFSIAKVHRNDNPKRGIYATKDAYVKTFSVKYSELFNKYGILCKKPERNVLNISKSVFKYFLLGLLDADGCITYTIRKDRDRLVSKVLITHPSIPLLTKVQNFLLEELNIPCSIVPKGTEKCFILSFSKQSDVLKFGDYLWSDKEAIVIKRKYEVFLQFKDIYQSNLQNGVTLPCDFMVTKEYSGLRGSMSKYVFISPAGKEYMSAILASRQEGGTSKEIQINANFNRRGWTRREKTETEKKDYIKYIRKETVRLYNLWIEKQ